MYLQHFVQKATLTFSQVVNSQEIFLERIYIALKSPIETKKNRLNLESYYQPKIERL